MQSLKPVIHQNFWIYKILWCWNGCFDCGGANHLAFNSPFNIKRTKLMAEQRCCAVGDGGCDEDTSQEHVAGIAVFFYC